MPIFTGQTYGDAGNEIQHRTTLVPWNAVPSVANELDEYFGWENIHIDGRSYRFPDERYRNREGS